jgi:hypothetical protein
MKIAQTRDCVALVVDASLPVMVDDTMAAAGWIGGTGVSWVSSDSDTFLVTYSDGAPGGFLLWGSNEESDQYVAYRANQQTYKFAQACFGTWIISTVAFEAYTLESRLAPPLVENVFVVGQRLRFSLRGLWTPQDEWAISADPRGSNTVELGMIIQAPSSQNNFHLMLQTAL